MPYEVTKFGVTKMAFEIRCASGGLGQEYLDKLAKAGYSVVTKNTEDDTIFFIEEVCAINIARILGQDIVVKLKCNNEYREHDLITIYDDYIE